MTQTEQLKALAGHLEQVIEQIANNDSIDRLARQITRLSDEIEKLRQAIEPQVLQVEFIPESLDS